MAMILKKPNTPGQRGMTVSDFKEITKKKPQKSLVVRLKKYSGRNNTGRITVSHRGGGAKSLYRIVDFKRQADTDLKVKAIEYDPNRSANIALVEDGEGKPNYILASAQMKPGLTIKPNTVKEGSTLKLKDIPTATFIHNIELRPGQGGKMCRAAGTYASFLGLDGKYAVIKLPSGETRKIVSECTATIGIVGNIDQNKVSIGKAGRKRHMGIRPTVRGKAQNPVDHPHGGGEGNTSLGMPGPKTPWGLPALGYKTRKKGKDTDKFIIKSRSKRKK